MSVPRINCVPRNQIRWFTMTSSFILICISGKDDISYTSSLINSPSTALMDLKLQEEHLLPTNLFHFSLFLILEGIKARSHSAAAVLQGFLPHTLPHRKGLEPIYLWHLVAPLLQPLPLLHSMNTHIGSNAFHFFCQCHCRTV